MHKYIIYGLNVVSDIKLNCYPADFEKEDIRIRFTENEDEAERWSNELGKNETSKCFNYENAGLIYVCNDSEIIACINENSNYVLTLGYLLGAAFTYILALKGIFALHANTVLYNEHGLLLGGASGAGKSSLATGLYKVGGKIVADDIARIEFINDFPYVCPSFPSLKLWKNIAGELDIDLNGAMRILPDKDKFILNHRDMFNNSKVSISAFINIVPDDNADIKLIKETTTNSLKILFQNTYGRRRIPDSGKSEDYYQFLLKLCERVPVYTLHRPLSTNTISGQVNMIIKEVFCQVDK